MKRFGVGTIGWVAVLAVLACGPRAMAQEEYPGAFYFGDSNPGDGVLGPGDIAVLKSVITIPEYDGYAGCNPPSKDVQELDGDGVIGPGDLNILIAWVTGNFSTGDAGKPDALEPVSGTNQVPIDGGTVICVKLADNPANGDMIKTPRAGWGVIFQIDPSSPCATATLYGRDPTPTIGLGKNQFVTVPVGDKVYAYTNRIGDGGRACVTVNATGCLDAQVIPIAYYAPGDDEALYQVGSKGRFPTRLNGTPAQIPVTVIGCCSHFVIVTPDTPTLNDGASIQMTATDSFDGDVTLLAAWAITSGACSVSATGLVTAPEGCANAACVVEATYLAMADDTTVNITDNEAADTVVLNCNGVIDGDAIDCAPSCSSAADGCSRACACIPTCASANCTGIMVNEGCADTTYAAECVESYGTAIGGAAVTDNEAGFWDALRPTNCGAGNDPIDVAAACSTPQRYSTADNCDRGPASCTWTCAGGVCGELCYPTLTAAFTGRCADAAAISEDGGTVINNETAATVTVTPTAPVNLWPIGTQDYLCSATFADGCNFSCDATAVWTHPGTCAGATISATGLYTASSTNAACTDVATATFQGGADGSTVNTQLLALTLAPNPASVNDGATVRLTATDNKAGNVSQNANTTWSVTSGACAVNNTSPNKGVVTAPEACANYSCAIQAVYDPAGADPARTGTATVNVIDNDAWDALRAIACGSSVDPINLAAVCTTPQRYSTVDNCDRGPANCAWSCAAGSCELCYPALTGAFTGRCADGAVWVEDGGTVTNDETIPIAVNLTPEGPIIKYNGQTTNLACAATFADACVYNAGPANLSDPLGCGALTGMTYTYAGFPPECAEAVTCNVEGVIDSETLIATDAPPPCPAIDTVFPLQGQPGVALRYSGNAHLNQVVTIVYSLMPSFAPDTATVTCTGPSAPALICDLANKLTDADIPCAPSGNFQPNSTYNCTATLTKAGCSNVQISGGFTTASAAAAPDGGTGAGYVGGLTYESGTTTVGPGTVTVTAVDAELNAAIPGKVYVQIIQGGTVTQRYTNASGVLSVSLADAPIDELTLGYKCGFSTCPKLEHGANWSQYKNGLDRDYEYTTLRDLDASDVVVRMSHMGNAMENRWRYLVRGTINESYFTAYIGPQPTGISTQGDPTARQLFKAPVKLRAAWVISTIHGLESIQAGLDQLLLSPDYETSISACVLFRINYSLGLRALLPPNLILPDLVRTDYRNVCTGWATNPGVYKWEHGLNNEGTYENLWSVGVYFNATLASQYGIDFTLFPLYVCGLGMRGVTVPPLSSDQVLNIGGDAGFRYDLREDWPGPLGYDPDVAVDRKIQVTAGPLLPIDPARQNATLRPVSPYRVPNLTDSELIADPTWDDRFYRKHVAIVSGADYGLAAGVGVSGLTLQTVINDLDFTTFRVAYFQSSSTKMGQRDLKYWTGGNTNVVSDTQAGPNSTWTDPTNTNLDWTAIDNAGPTNYLAIAILNRGAPIDGRSSDPSRTLLGTPTINPFYHLAPGSIASVWHVGPPEAGGNEVIEATDWLNLSVALAPNPDTYIYPAPQWGNTPRASRAINRNGELWQIRTTSASDGLPSANGRYYFQFTRPSMMHNSSRAIHVWRLALAEDDLATGFDGVSNVGMVPKRSSKSKVISDTGECQGTNTFNDAQARFQNQGVAIGDTLWINSRRNGCLNTNLSITAVLSQTSLTVSPNWGVAPNCGAAGDIRTHYKVIRQFARGECQIDERFGGGPGGYNCRANHFWRATGPANHNPERVYAPQVTPGPATLAGVTGYVPTLWDLAQPTQLRWDRTWIVYGTQAAGQGGLGGAFDYNNWNMRADAQAIQHLSTDSSHARYQ